MLIVNMAPGLVSMRFGAKGPNSSVVTACASGNHAIGDAVRLIERGDADVMIAGGAEAIIVPLTIAGLLLDEGDVHPQRRAGRRPSRPFDAERATGSCAARAPASVILESLEHARARDARIYAEIVGYGMTGDAHHLTAPDPEGDGAARAMAAGAARRRAWTPRRSATSTPTARRRRTTTSSRRIAIKRVFGDHARRLAVSSTKSMTGPPAGRRRRRRGDRDRAGAPPRRPAADHQLRDAGSRLRSRLRAEPGPQARRRGGAVERVRLRRHERDARLSNVRRVGGPVRVAGTRAAARLPVPRSGLCSSAPSRMPRTPTSTRRRRITSSSRSSVTRCWGSWSPSTSSRPIRTRRSES